MDKLSKKSGQNAKFGRRVKKSLRVRLNEQSEKIGSHFSELFIKRLANVIQVRLWVFEWVLLVLLVFLLAVVQMFWYDQAHETSAFVYGGTYVEASMGDVKTLNPLYASTDSEKILARLLFANLVSPDASGHEKGVLAKSVRGDETGKVWTLKLRENLKWSDGEPINADDVIYTIDLLNDTSAKTAIKADFSRTKVEKIDDLTVKFTLPSVYIDFMDTLEFPLLPAHKLAEIKPALVYENEFSTSPVGSGPFVINVMQKGDATDAFSQVIYLNRNNKYYGQNTKLANYTLKVYDSTDDIIAALKNGSVRGTASLGVNAAEQLGNTIARRTSLLNGGVFAFINTETLAKAELRQAIQQGVDMGKVREGMDDSQILDYPILERQDPDFEYPKLAKYDTDAAKKLIEKAGYKFNNEGKIVDEAGDVLTINMSVLNRETLSKVAERFAEQLRTLGFTVRLEIVDDSQVGVDFFTSVVQPRNYDILIYEIDMGVSTDPFVYYSSTQAGTSGWNLSNYSNGLADDALLSAHTTTSTKLRKAKYEAFLRYWAEDVPSIGIYQSSMNYYYAEDTQIFSENILMTDAYDRFLDVEYWATEKRDVELTP